MALFKATKEAPTEEGDSTVECQRVGQVLVESNHVTPEVFAATLAQANGDLLAFADGLLARHGVGRTELALAISQATGVPAVDTKGIVIPEELRDGTRRAGGSPPLRCRRRRGGRHAGAAVRRPHAGTDASNSRPPLAGRSSCSSPTR